MTLPVETFKDVVRHIPLISIDFVIKNQAGEILLGKRINRPAQNYWFVPGGRILKDETIHTAFKRLFQAETCMNINHSEATFLGPYEHFYSDNFSNEDFSTHYVVLAYEVNLEISIMNLPKSQHNEYKWLSVEDLLSSENVHQHTKNYFI